MDILRSIAIWLIGITIICIFFPVTFIIWFIVLPFDKNRSVMHWMLTWQSIIISYLIPVWKIHVEGRKKAIPGETYVIISNHQSILDILIVNFLRYRFKWISKIENMKRPVLGWYLRMAEYITVDRGDKESKEKMIAEAYEVLKNGTSVMIFPEGTRSPDREIKFFKRGAFQLAISTKRPLLPILIDGTGGVLPKHGVIFGGFHEIKLKVLDPVDPEQFGTDDCDELAMRFQAMMTDELNRLRTGRKQDAAD